MDREPTTMEKAYGDFAPKIVELTDKVLFGDVWERPGLSKRDRSLITVAALIALNRPEQLRSHLQRARENGVTKDEVVEGNHAFGLLHRVAQRDKRCPDRQRDVQVVTSPVPC